MLGRNYESPVFGTYELLLSRLAEFREAEAAAAACSSRSHNNSSTNLQLDSEYARRGSRGSIISGRANVEPAEHHLAAIIPAHHLAKLSLSTSPDYVRVVFVYRSEFSRFCTSNIEIQKFSAFLKFSFIIKII